jgi:signal transduction histidine kinase
LSSLPSPSNIHETLDGQLADAQRQLDDLRRQVAETQRLAAIGTIAAVIAHEFNNLLTPMVSYCQYALSSAQGDRPDMDLIRKALSKTYQSAEKAGKICTSMLGLARGQSTFDDVPVQVLVDDVLAVLARDPEKDNIALRLQVQPNLRVRCDRVQIEQVLLNLLINARQAMLGKGGSLTIKASADPGSDQARIQVIDTGSGIPERLMPKIFQPFFTTKGTAMAGQVRGTGLGLAICKQIVENHHGRIEVDSQVGKGTTFSVWVPLATSNASTPGCQAA